MITTCFNEAMGLREGTKFSRAMRYMTGFRRGENDIGIITSENPLGKQLPDAENRELLKKLKTRLSEMGIPFTQQWGRYGYDENSLFITDVPVKTLIELAREFRQASFIWGVREENGEMSFGYCDLEANDITDIRHRVVTGPEAQKRDDFVSGFLTRIRKKGDKKGEVFFRKYFIPFFQDEEKE